MSRARGGRDLLHVVHVQDENRLPVFRDGIAITVALSTQADPYRLPVGAACSLDRDVVYSPAAYDRSEAAALAVANHVVGWQGFLTNDGDQLPCAREVVVAVLRMRPPILAQLQRELVLLGVITPR
jgi:hypothetical protein